MTEKKEHLKICAIQTEIEKDPRRNKDKIKKYVSEATSEDVDLVCLPELPIYGFDYELISELSSEDILEQNKFFSELAAANRVYLIAGVVEKEKGDYFDSAALFDKEGRKAFSYQKTHLWAKERDFFTPGTSLEVVDIEGWSVGLAICADLGFPEVSRKHVLKGAELLIYTSAWMEPYDELWRLLLKSRAAENLVYVLGCNAMGTKDDFCGDSMIVDPTGRYIKRLGKEEGLLTADIYIEMVNSRRNEIPWLSYRIPSLYQL